MAFRELKYEEKGGVIKCPLQTIETTYSRFCKAEACPNGLASESSAYGAFKRCKKEDLPNLVNETRACEQAKENAGQQA